MYMEKCVCVGGGGSGVERGKEAQIQELEEHN